MGKQYISIIRLFENCHIPYEGELNISRTKKQLNAEFGFAASGILEFEGYVYNKNDVLGEIERKDFLERLIYHIGVWNNKSILGILEDSVFNKDELRTEIAKFHNDHSFDAFFSPYFAGPFNNISRNLLNELRLDTMAELLLYEDFLQAEDREVAFKPIRVFLDENIYLLKNASEINMATTVPEISHWSSANSSELLNYLPYELDDLKNDLVAHLIGFTVKIQKSNKKLCKALSRELTKVTDLHPELRDTIVNNDRVYNNISVGRSSEPNYWWVIWVVFILLRMLANC